MRRLFALSAMLSLFFSSFVVFAPRASAADGVQCWVASFIYRNDTASVGSVLLHLHDNSPETHYYSSTQFLSPGQTGTVSIYGRFPSDATSFSSDATSATLTFLGFGPFERVSDTFCSKPVPSLGLHGLLLLTGLLAAMGALTLKRRAPKLRWTRLLQRT